MEILYLRVRCSFQKNVFKATEMKWTETELNWNLNSVQLRCADYIEPTTRAVPEGRQGGGSCSLVILLSPPLFPRKKFDADKVTTYN